MRQSITARLTAWYAAVTAFVLLLSGLFVYSGASAAYRNATLRELQTQADTVLARLASSGENEAPAADGESTGNHAGLFDEDLLAGLDGTAAQIADTAGRVRVRTPAAPPRMPLAPVGRLSWFESRGLTMAYLVTPVPQGGRTVAFLTVAVPWEPAEASLAELLKRLLWDGAAGLLMATAGGYAIARAAMRRVDRITTTAARIGAEDMSARLPLSGPKDELYRLSATFNAMLDRIQAAYLRQRRFVADASHELRTPITILHGHARMLLRWGKSDPGVLDASLAAIERETAYLGRLVEDLLQLARADEGKGGSLPLHPARVDLAALARDTLETVRSVAGRRSLKYEGEPSLEMTADAVRLRQMLLALLDNALRHTADDGTVRLSVRRGGGGATREAAAVLEVADDGPGIPPESREEVFERFVRLKGGPRRTSGGAGLGLAIAREIVEAHGGRIEAGEAPEGGALFRVWLPLEARARER
ncbi:MAG: HAMP domain-containing protein [Firmicutes bacterium]|nr:HAMP domain-containing protein [Bacillota bacterium]